MRSRVWASERVSWSDSSSGVRPSFSARGARARRERCVRGVEGGGIAAGVGEGGEIGGEGDARQFAFQIGGVTPAVLGMVEQGVEVVEDLFLGDREVGVVLAELRDGGVFEVG